MVLLAHDEVILRDQAAQARLKQFNTAALRRVADEAGIAMDGSVRTRNDVVLALVKGLGWAVTREIVQRLEIYNVMLPNSTIVWRVYDLSLSAGAASLSGTACQHVAQALSVELSKLYRAAIDFVVERQTEVWMHVMLESDAPGGAPCEFFLMYQSRTSVVFVTLIPEPFLRCVRGVIAAACGAVTMTQRELTSRHLRSLVELVLHRDASGAFRRYENQLEPTPLQRDAVANANSVARGLARQAKRAHAAAATDDERKRRVVDGKLPDAEPRQRLVEEDAAERAAHADAAHAALGAVEHLAPVQAIEVQSQRAYAGAASAVRRAPEQPLAVRIRLRGAHVLQGVHALIADGAVRLPLPPLYSSLSKLDSLKLHDSEGGVAVIDAEST